MVKFVGEKKQLFNLIIFRYNLKFEKKTALTKKVSRSDLEGSEDEYSYTNEDEHVPTPQN